MTQPYPFEQLFPLDAASARALAPALPMMPPAPSPDGGPQIVTGLVVHGAKKGGGSGATEAKDSLRSTQTATVLDLISEGPCIGLVDGLKSVYFDKVALQDASGTNNWAGTELQWTLGTQGQAAIGAFDSVQTEVAVAVRVQAATPLVRSIAANSGANKVRVTIGIPQLTKLDTGTGDLTGSTVEVAVDRQSNGGGYVQVLSRVVDGKCTSRYQFSVLVDLSGTGPWDIRVRRVTPDATSLTINDQTWWDSYTLVTSAKLRYPNSAIVGAKVSAEMFSRIPERAYDWMGLIVSVPSNYNPYTRNYTGTWDGTFKQEWTNNPAWVFYDLAVKKRYGVGQRIDPALLNKWTLYQIARYNDAVDANGNYVGVPDGRGGVEPRFTCNLYLQVAQDATTLLRDLAGLMRACLSWVSSSIELMQDAPSTAVMLYTPANVIDGVFRYEGTSKGLKKSGCIVYWNNPANFGQREPELYQDPDLVAKYGVENMTLSPLGITSRGQALRVAKWAVYSEAYEGKLVRFSVGSDGVLSGIGRIIKIADPSEAGERLGGRLKAVTLTTVTLDKPVQLRAGETYTISLMIADPTGAFGLTTIERAITTGAGTTDVLTLSGGVPAGTVAGGIWVLQSNLVAATTWRVLRVAEMAGSKFEIMAISHNPSKFNYIELGLKLENKPVSRLGLTATIPINLTCTETVVVAGSAVYSRVVLGWTPTTPGLQYQLSWRSRLGVWQTEPQTTSTSVEINDLLPGRLDVNVRAVNPMGSTSPPLQPPGGYFTVLGTNNKPPPPDPTGFTAVAIPGAIRFSWDMPTHSDFAPSELRRGASWSANTRLDNGAAGSTASATNTYDWSWPAAGTYTVLLRHKDTLGNLSAGTASLFVTVTDAGIATVTHGENILKNPSFKQGSMAGWALGGQNLLTAEFTAEDRWGGLFKLNGDEAAYVHLTSATYAGDTAYADVSTTVFPVLAGRQYQSSALVQTHRSGVMMYIIFYNAAGAQIGFAGNLSGSFSALGANGAGNLDHWVDTGVAKGGCQREEQFDARLFSTWIVPPGATQALMALRMWQKPGLTDQYLFIARAKVGEVGGSPTQPVPFDWGGSALAGLQQIGTKELAAWSTVVESRNWATGPFTAAGDILTFTVTPPADGTLKMTINIDGRITSVTGRASGAL